ncbi:MAG: 4Fe-4S dicluster domain-containing protein [Bacilli bacterium]|nr:4Fe-4S dicluster domain-containing protein [Bacilli bacterium]
MINLYKEKNECCGCSACASICPTQAITMEPDEDGFFFPVVNNSKCIRCRMCLKTCHFRDTKIKGNRPLAAFAAINKDETVLKNSSSGGAFSALASIVLEMGGVVFGCAFNERMEPNHIGIDNFFDIEKLQGSKYVQSKINNTFIEAKRLLDQGRIVLYSGTPCQIAGLKSYLGREYNNLLTVDLICHGVPSESFFKDYISWLEKKNKWKIITYKFRDKGKVNMGYSGKVIYIKKNGKIGERTIYWPLDCYYYYFLNGDICRMSCYECKYASNYRQGDFTLGDYWGVKKIHPEVNTQNGVSLLLINTETAMGYVDKLSNYLKLVNSDFEQAKKYNGQLNHPVPKSEKREMIFKTWHTGGYTAVANEFYFKNRKMIVVNQVKIVMLQIIKKIIKILKMFGT